VNASECGEGQRVLLGGRKVEIVEYSSLESRSGEWEKVDSSVYSLGMHLLQPEISIG
jgi:hypothetical protein